MEPIRESEEEHNNNNNNNNSLYCCGVVDDNNNNSSKNSSSKSFGKKCSHIAKKQRAKFYIVRRCIAMLVCWHERKE
ncbi:hypothetical protein T459_22588 [Capsicum annuum]|uniref:DVL-like protein n=1 Tax=Capsicum annuum TaxID=4072 RepID=A0A2G2YPX6_CAPAN|nr:hypothetical protein T459_22588 [Capsicum annuum]